MAAKARHTLFVRHSGLNCKKRESGACASTTAALRHSVVMGNEPCDSIPFEVI